MTAAVPPDPLFVELQTTLAGRYSLERELGRGGMGIVYLARDVALDRLVAIKLLRPELASETSRRERFLHEARTAARLSHPNIVPIHTVEESGRLVWFVMAYVPGETLGARAARGALTPGDALPILRDIAWALGHAHTQGVVHRDVKPDNILLESGGRRALIADFGIAAPLRSDLGPDGSVAGTVAYLSPEQARGDAVDGRTDLYALGVVGYFILAGRLPYPATTLAELVSLQLAGPPEPLADTAPHLPRVVGRAIDRCLAGYATARFQTGEELAGALEQLGSAPSNLPAPLRVWITQGTQRRGPPLFISIAWGIPVTVGSFVGWITTGQAPFLLAVASGLFLTTLPWVGYGALRTLHTRRLLKAGYTHADIVHALGQHLERRKEELAFEFGAKPTRIGLLMNASVGMLITMSVALLLLPPLVHSPKTGDLAGLSLVSAVAAVLVFLSRNMISGARGGARDWIAEFAQRFWRGSIGRWMTRVAAWGVRPKSAPEELVHRATEVALGQAAEALYRALPVAERRDLAKLPDQLAFLSAQAQVMRRKIAELDDLIAKAAPDTLFGERSHAGGDGGTAELGEARAMWAAQLRDTVALLESLRVGLLKLHAGSAVPSSLTEDLDAARALKERLQLLAEGQSEVDRL